MKILFIHFRPQYEKLQAERKTFLNAFKLTGMDTSCLQIESLNALANKTDWENLDPYNWDRIIFGGSELSFEGTNSKQEREQAMQTAKEMTPFILRLIESSVPSLAICFGHQVFGFATNGCVQKDACLGKSGSYKVELTKDGKNDPLFTGIRSPFYANYMHQDVICINKPEHLKILANGERCKYAALLYGSNSYTLQFHPELTSQDLLEKLEMYPQYLRKGANPADLVHYVSESHKILRNFIEEL